MEKLYLIPKNLDSQFELFLGYTLIDVVQLLLLLAGGGFGVLYTHSALCLLPVIGAVVLKCRVQSYCLHFWIGAALRYLFNRMSKKGVYTLFEKEDVLDWRC